MTAQETAIDLYKYFNKEKVLALMKADEMIRCVGISFDKKKGFKEYWQQVKEEINKL